MGHGGHFIGVHPDGKELDRLSALVDGGKLKNNIVSMYPMQEAASALGESMAGHAGGKIVLREFTS